MRFIKLAILISALFFAFAGVVFVRLNAARINSFLQNIALQNGLVTVEVVQIPATGNGVGNIDTSQINKIAMSAETIGSADLPPKKPLAEKTVSAPSVAEMPLPDQNQASDGAALTRKGVIVMTNAQRQANLGAGFDLIENSQLDAVAVNKVKDMFSGQYFEHVSPAGRDAAYFVGVSAYEYITIGENLALGDYKDDAAVVKAWMDSPGHRENILKPGYKEIGVAVGFGIFKGRKTWLAVQEFGIPKSACPEVSSELSVAIDSGKKTMDQYSEQQDSLLTKVNENKERAAALEKELNDLVAVHSSMAAIKAKYSELNAVIVQINSSINEYNVAIPQMRAAYDAYKSDISRYNEQVNVYNACVESF